MNLTFSSENLLLWLALQVSALGVWGTPLEVACRAADLVVALPTHYLLAKIYWNGHVAGILPKMVMVMQAASQMLKSPSSSSPFMSTSQLQGGRSGLLSQVSGCRSVLLIRHQPPDSDGSAAL
jgi:hypothetical protein